MRSEIPQIEVITAIADADFEDFVAQLLYSQGWSIIFRAFDAQALIDQLTLRRSLRTVIVYKADLPGFTSDSILTFEDSPFTFISLDGSEPAAHAIMQKIRSQLRLPLLQRPVREDRPSEVSADPKIYTFLGSSPNRSSLAIALGQKLGEKSSYRSGYKPGYKPGQDPSGRHAGRERIALIDADFRSHSLSRKLGEMGREGESFTLLSLDGTSKPRAFPEVEDGATAIVDIGLLPPLGEAVHDRRWYGNLITSILEATSHMLYVVSSTEESLDELAQFLKEFPILLRKIPITYICVLVGSARELRQAEARFLTLTNAENRFIIRESQLDRGTGLFGSLIASKTGKSEIGKIAQSIR